LECHTAAKFESSLSAKLESFALFRNLLEIAKLIKAP
jgi:hypothetical protein